MRKSGRSSTYNSVSAYAATATPVALDLGIFRGGRMDTSLSGGVVH